MTGSGDRPVSPAGTIRVASYNLRALQDDVGAAAEVVRSLDPDVLLLQEVPRRPLSSSTIAAFARRCDLLWSGRTRRVCGTSLMTSIRVIATDAEDRPLPFAVGKGLRGLNPRCYTVARVHRPGGPGVSVVSVHLPLFPEERLAHARRVLAELAADPVHALGPLVLGGDINESGDGASWALLAERLRLATATGPTFPAARPQHRIDAVFASAEIPVLGHRQARLGPALLRAASDHLPVWADLRW